MAAKSNNDRGGGGAGTSSNSSSINSKLPWGTILGEAYVTIRTQMAEREAAKQRQLQQQQLHQQRLLLMQQPHLQRYQQLPNPHLYMQQRPPQPQQLHRVQSVPVSGMRGEPYIPVGSSPMLAGASQMVNGVGRAVFPTGGVMYHSTPRAQVSGVSNLENFYIFKNLLFTVNPLLVTRKSIKVPGPMLLRPPACSPVQFPTTPGRAVYRHSRPPIPPTHAAAIDAIVKQLQQPPATSIPQLPSTPTTSSTATDNERQAENGMQTPEKGWREVTNKEFSVLTRGLDLRRPTINDDFIYFFDQPSSATKENQAAGSDGAPKVVEGGSRMARQILQDHEGDKTANVSGGGEEFLSFSNSRSPPKTFPPPSPTLLPARHPPRRRGGRTTTSSRWQSILLQALPSRPPTQSPPPLPPLQKTPPHLYRLPYRLLTVTRGWRQMRTAMLVVVEERCQHRD